MKIKQFQFKITELQNNCGRVKMQPCPLSFLFLLAVAALELIILPTGSLVHALQQGINPSITKPDYTASGSGPSSVPPLYKKMNESEEFLEEHNQARAAVGVPLQEWNPNLAKLTSRLVRYQRDKKGCGFAVLSNRGKYGANQLWASGLAVAPRAAVQAWVKEKNYYNHTDNSCAPHHRCGVYKQVVWKKSLEVGCAQATCEGHVTLTICLYSPPGNAVGESPY